MGQDNEKIQFENQNQGESKRKAIFKSGKDAAPRERCDIPGCKCPLQHGEYDTKICEECKEQPPPFLRNKNHPSYYKDDHQSKKAESKIDKPQQHHQKDDAQSIPTKISYYNAWSLPTQKYYLRDRPHFHNKAQHRHEQKAPQERQNVDSIIKRNVIERIALIADVPLTEEDKRRKQNMNLAD